MVDQVAELLAVAGAAPGVRVQHHVAGGGVELDLGGERGAVVGEGPAVDLQDQRVRPGRVEARRLHDPALDPAPVVGGLVPDLLDLSQGLVAQEVPVEPGQPPGLHPGADDGHVCWMVGPPVGEGHPISAAHGEGAAAVGPTHGETAQLVGDGLHLTVEGGEADLRGALVAVGEEDPAPVRGPGGIVYAAVEGAGDHPPSAPVPVHDVEPRDLVALVAVVVARVGDAPAVGGDRRVPVGAVAVGQGPDAPVRDPDLVDLGVRRVVLVVLVAVRGEDQVLAVGRPLGGAVVIGSVGEPPGRATLRGHHEDVPIPRFQEAAPVRLVADVVHDPDRRPPFRALRGVGHPLGEGALLVGDEHGEGEPVPVGGPRQARGRLGEGGQLRGLPRLHPADPDLRAVVLARDVGDAVARGRPPGRGDPGGAVGQGPVTGAPAAHDPEGGGLGVLHDVVAGAHVDHGLAVGGDPGILPHLQAEDVHGLEAVGPRAFRRLCGQEAGKEKRARGEGHEGLGESGSGAHLVLLDRVGRGPTSTIWPSPELERSTRSGG